eukprot:403335965
MNKNVNFNTNFNIEEIKYSAANTQINTNHQTLLNYEDTNQEQKSKRFVIGQDSEDENDSNQDSIEENATANIQQREFKFQNQFEDKLIKQQDIQKYSYVWHDPNLDDYENQLHYKTFLDKKVNIYVFENMYSASKYITDKKEQTFILITSGTNGENFVNYVHDYKNVKSIVVFCLNVMYHETWAKRYMKVDKVTRDPEFLIHLTSKDCPLNKDNIIYYNLTICKVIVLYTNAMTIQMNSNYHGN